MTRTEKQLWIEKRYGHIRIRTITLYVASVPLYKGSAEGDGMTESDAVEALYNDLTLMPMIAQGVAPNAPIPQD